MGLTLFVARRVAIAAVTILVITVVVFAAMQQLPGGYEDVMLGPRATPEQRAQVAARYGLDDPAVVQYGRWLSAAARGDLGTSFTSGQPVRDEFARRAPATLQLMLMALLFAVVVGVPLGVIAGFARSRVSRGASRFTGALAMSVPDFVLGSVLLYVFSSWSLGLTVGGYVPFTSDPVTSLRSTVLPAVTLGLFGVALVMRTQLSSVRTVASQTFVAAAVGRGEDRRAIIRSHILRNASIPLVTVVAVLSGYLISGSVIAETIFSVPGLGVFFVNAVQARNYAVVQAGVLVAAVVFVTVNMLADVLYAVLDPRVAAGGGEGAVR